MDTTSHIVGQLRVDDLPSLAHHRHHSTWEVAADFPDHYLLRAPFSEEAEAQFRSLPLTRRWHLRDAGRLILPSKALPDRILPILRWQSLSAVLTIQHPTTRQAEDYFGHTDFSLATSNSEQTATAVTLPFEKLAQWAETGPAPRLETLRFALSSAGQALVLGTPLLPLQATTYYPVEQLFLPTGFALPPHITPSLIASSLRTAPSDLILLTREGATHVIPSEVCLPLSRAAVRLSHRSLLGHV